MISEFIRDTTNTYKFMFNKVDSFCKFSKNGYKVWSDLKTTTGKITLIAGLGLGTCYFHFNDSLLTKAVQILGVSPTTRLDPFGEMSVSSLLLLTPFGCLVGPCIEEFIFRGDHLEVLSDKLFAFYKNRGFSDQMSHLATRTTSIFISSVLFSGVHLLNTAEDYSAVYAQSLVALSAGFLFEIAKDQTGGLLLPIALHIGNNCAAFNSNIQHALSRV